MGKRIDDDLLSQPRTQALVTQIWSENPSLEACPACTMINVVLQRIVQDLTGKCLVKGCKRQATFRQVVIIPPEPPEITSLRIDVHGTLCEKCVDESIANLTAPDSRLRAELLAGGAIAPDRIARLRVEKTELEPAKTPTVEGDMGVEH